MENGIMLLVVIFAVFYMMKKMTRESNMNVFGTTPANDETSQQRDSVDSEEDDDTMTTPDKTSV